MQILVQMQNGYPDGLESGKNNGKKSGDTVPLSTVDQNNGHVSN